MQAVILAAGKSTRTYPLTLTRPKPLLKAANKTLLEHNLDNIDGIADEVIIVVGYKESMIKKYIGNKYKSLKIRYVEQKQQLGTAHAVSLAEQHIKDRFILLMGDDLYSSEDIKKCVKHRYSILAAKVKNPQNFGVVIEKNGILADFVEKPKKFVSSLISTAFYSLDREIFKYIRIIKKSARNELEMPDAVKLLSKNQKIRIVRSKKWLPIVYAWDLLKADRVLRKNKSFIGSNTRVSGLVKDSSIGSGCVIDGMVRNSIVMDNAVIHKNSIVDDSVIGENVHFSGEIEAKSNAYSAVGYKKIKAGRIGAIIGDNAIAKNVIVKAGSKIWPGMEITGTINMDVK
ncbi:NTP transferase domain-containing protein [Candidatus Woesearchaeota archaeon]|nr:NTP transferase domain-containing protein [Candidatus Woesearchaeota archaeon]